MLTFLTWACYVYAIVWAVAFIVFYLIGRACADEYERPSVWGPVVAGFAWPVVLSLLAYMLWTMYRDRGAYTSDLGLDFDTDRPADGR